MIKHLPFVVGIFSGILGGNALQAAVGLGNNSVAGIAVYAVGCIVCYIAAINATEFLMKKRRLRSDLDLFEKFKKPKYKIGDYLISTRKSNYAPYNDGTICSDGIYSIFIMDLRKIEPKANHLIGYTGYEYLVHYMEDNCTSWSMIEIIDDNKEYRKVK